MARLQILQLPEGASDDRPPFVLFVDQAGENETEMLRSALAEGPAVANKIGARCVPRRRP